MLEHLSHTSPWQKPDQTGTALPLRKISWAELSLRFKAMRDYRRATRLALPVSGGSFGALAAQHLAQAHHGINPVNPDASTLGKDTCATIADIEQSV